jgi:hypothetical protein
MKPAGYKSNEPSAGDVIAVWFSCGAASAVAAKLTLEKHPECTVRVINNPVKEEDEDNRRFLKDVERWIGQEIEIATNENYPECSAREVWEKRKYMEGVAGAPCTLELKKKARQQWEANNHHDWIVLGFTWEEQPRFDRFKMMERENILPVLIEDKISKPECYQRILEAGIKLPRVYRMGYPNANCIGCVKATSPTYWNHVRENHPEVFADRAEQSRRLGARLVRYKNERIFLDELPEDAAGADMKNMDFECGIFCEEREE